MPNFLPALRDFCSWAPAITGRSHTVDTQLVTFRILVAVITRYPGIRHLFYHPKGSEQMLSTFKKNWTRAHQDCGDSWTFYRDYTLHCLSDSKLTALVEEKLPSKFACLLEDSCGRVPIEELLSLCRSVPFFFPADALIPHFDQAQSRSLTIPNSVLSATLQVYWNYQPSGRRE